MESNFDWKAIISLGSLVVSVFSLVVVVYTQFFQGAKLSGVIGSITILRMPNANKVAIMHELFLSDLMGANPTSQGAELLRKFPKLAEKVRQGDRNAVVTEFESEAKAGRAAYKIPNVTAAQLATSPQFILNFHVPIIVSNQGRKTGLISNLVLLIRLADDKSKKWVFVPFMEIDPLKLMPLPDNKPTLDQELIKSVFTGSSVPAQSSEALQPWFIPINQHNGKQITPHNLLPGKYEAAILGYGERGERAFSSNWLAFELTEENIVHAFEGSHTTNNITVGKNIDDSLTLSK